MGVFYVKSNFVILILKRKVKNDNRVYKPTLY